MKICLLEHHDNPYPVMGYGGIERINQSLYKTLLDLGHEVSLIITNRTTLEYKHGKLIKLPYSEIEDLRYGRIKLMDVLEEQYDIFHTHLSGPVQNINFDGFNGIWTAHCHGDFEDAGCPNQIFCSHTQFLAHIKHYNILRKCKNIFVCHNGVEDSVLHYVENLNRKYVLWFSHICPAKAPHIAIAIAQHLNLELVLAGNISDNNYYNQYVLPYLNDRIKYIGLIKTEEEKKNLFADALCYLHTAVTNETFATTVLESQMCGVPVLSLNYGSAFESNFDAELVSESPFDIAQKLNQKVYNNINRVELRQWATKNFSNLAMTNRILNVWRTVINEE